MIYQLRRRYIRGIARNQDARDAGLQLTVEPGCTAEPIAASQLDELPLLPARIG